MSEFSVKTLLITYVALMLLLALTVVAGLFPLGSLSAPISIGIAIAKAFLIMYFFMKLGLASQNLRVVAFAGVFFLILLTTLTFADYLTRFSIGILGK